MRKCQPIMALLLSCSSVRLAVLLGRPIVVSRASSTISFNRHGFDENSSVKRARLLYQCRKRGTLENGILLSSFASKHLKEMNDSELVEFDSLLNRTENDWQLYYWMTGRETAPPEFDCSILHRLREHCQKLTHTTNQQPPITPNHIYLSQ